MDTTQRRQKAYSSFPRAKSASYLFLLRKIVLTLTIALGIGFGCSSTTKTTEFSVSNLKDKRELELFQMTSRGTNAQGSFNFNSTKIVYVGSDRESHKTGQIYELDLASKRERRINFNAGTDVYPIYHPKEDLILFSSTTDFVQENLPLDSLKASLGLIERAPQNTIEMPPHDLYLRSTYGTNIRRLTETPGYDGDAKFTPDGKKVIFSKFTNQEYSIGIMNLQTGGNEKINLKYLNLRWPSIFYHGKEKKMAGILETPTYSRLLVQDILNPNTLVYETSDTAVYQQPSWHPKEFKLVVSSNRVEKNNFDLFVYDFTNKCVQRVTYSKALDQEPSFSPVGDQIIFTSNRTGQNQIFMIRYDASQPCESFPTSI